MLVAAASTFMQDLCVTIYQVYLGFKTHPFVYFFNKVSFKPSLLICTQWAIRSNLVVYYLYTPLYGKINAKINNESHSHLLVWYVHGFLFRYFDAWLLLSYETSFDQDLFATFWLWRNLCFHSGPYLFNFPAPLLLYLLGMPTLMLHGLFYICI